MRKQYHIHLTPEQRAEARPCWPAGTAAALTARHARILLEADDAVRRRVRSDRQVAELCGVSAAHRGPRARALRPRRVCRGAARATPPGLGPQALRRAGGAPHRPGLHRAAGGPGPLERAAAGRARRGAGGAAADQPRTGAHHAQKNRLKPWRRQAVADPARRPTPPSWRPWRTCWPSMPGPSIRARPLVCFDEAGKDLKAHTRPPQPAAPGRAAREDSDYARARQPQSVSGLCPPPGLAPDRASPRSAPPSTSPTPCATLVDRQFPAGRAHRAGAGQPQHPHPGRALSGLPAGRSVAHPGAAGVALHPHPRQLAQHGRAGVVGAGPPVPGPAHPRPGHAGDRGRGLGGGAQCRAPSPPPGTSPRRRRASACPGSTPIPNRSLSPCHCTQHDTEALAISTVRFPSIIDRHRRAGTDDGRRFALLDDSGTGEGRARSQPVAVVDRQRRSSRPARGRRRGACPCARDSASPVASGAVESRRSGRGPDETTRQVIASTGTGGPSRP